MLAALNGCDARWMLGWCDMYVRWMLGNAMLYVCWDMMWLDVC